MTVKTFFAGAAIFALATASTFADTLSDAPRNGLATLWNQNSNFSGGGVDSTNFTSGTSYNSAAADDFIVPAGETWTVKEVDVSNACYNGTCQDSFNITFFANAKGLPGKIVKTFSNVSCTNSDSCTIKGVKLSGGTRGRTYWVSVVDNNCSFIQGCGEYAWATTATVRGHEAVWENPGGGYGYCQTWEPLNSCFGGSPADLAFELRGKRS